MAGTPSGSASKGTPKLLFASLNETPNEARRGVVAINSNSSSGSSLLGSLSGTRRSTTPATPATPAPLWPRTAAAAAPLFPDSADDPAFTSEADDITQLSPGTDVVNKLSDGAGARGDKTKTHARAPDMTSRFPAAAIHKQRDKASTGTPSSSTGVTYSSAPRPPAVAAAGTAAMRRSEATTAAATPPPTKKRVVSSLPVDVDAEEVITDDGDSDVFTSRPPSAQQHSSKPPQRAASAASRSATRLAAALEVHDDGDDSMDEFHEHFKGPAAWQQRPSSQGARTASVAGRLQPRGALQSRSTAPPRQPVPVATPEPPRRRPALAPGEFPHYPVEKITICDAIVNQQPGEPLILTLTLDAIDIKGLVERVRMPYKMLSICEYNSSKMVALLGMANKDMDALESKLHLIKQMYHDDVRKARGPFLVAAYFYGREDLDEFVKDYNMRAPNAGGSPMNTIDAKAAASFWPRIYKHFSVPHAAAPSRRAPARLAAWTHEPVAPVTTLFEYPFKSPGDPTGPVRGAVTVTSDDTARLNEGEFLNDTLIDFQIKWIIEHAGADALQRSVIYNSFLHRKLQKLCSAAAVRKQPQLDRFTAMARWNREDIFTKDFLIIPMNEALHWFLGIVAYPGRLVAAAHAVAGDKVRAVTVDTSQSTSVHVDGSGSDADETADEAADSGPSASPLLGPASSCAIMVLDSLSGLRPSAFTLLTSFLHQELLRTRPEIGHLSQAKFRKLITTKSTRVPQQMNHSDCGLFVLKYIEKFLVDGDTATRELLANRYERWFPNEDVEGMRQQMQGIIETLQIRYERHRAAVTAAAAAANAGAAADTSSDLAAVDSAGDAASAVGTTTDMTENSAVDMAKDDAEPDSARSNSAVVSDSVSEVVTQQDDMDIVL